MMMLRRLPARRARFLLMFGAIYIVYGFALLKSPNAPNLAIINKLTYHAAVIAVPWVVSGLIAIWSGITHPKHEWFGFTALYFMAGLWATSFGISGIARTMDRPWPGIIVWSLVVGVILLIAGWPDPDVPEPLRGPTEEEQ